MTSAHVICKDIAKTSKWFMAYFATERSDRMDALHMIFKTANCLEIVMTNWTLKLEVRLGCTVIDIVVYGPSGSVNRILEVMGVDIVDICICECINHKIANLIIDRNIITSIVVVIVTVIDKIISLVE